MMKTNLLILFNLLFFMGCQQQPTKAIQESVDVFENKTVLMDTRSALEFESFHIQGSKSLVVEDFLVVKNPMSKKKKTYQLDPQITDVISRLARRGIHPSKTVYLIGKTKNSEANKRWKWLLSVLEVQDVQMFSIDEIKKIRNGRFAEAEQQSAWTLKSSEELQNEFIYKKAEFCFVRWTESQCSF